MSYDVLSQATEVYANADEKVFGDLTVAEFDAVHDAIDNVTEVGQNARKIEIDGERHDLDTVLGSVLAAVAERSEGRNADLRRRLKALAAGAVTPLSVEAAQRPVELWAQDMDGGEAGLVRASSSSRCGKRLSAMNRTGLLIFARFTPLSSRAGPNFWGRRSVPRRLDIHLRTRGSCFMRFCTPAMIVINASFWPGAAGRPDGSVFLQGCGAKAF